MLKFYKVNVIAPLQCQAYPGRHRPACLICSSSILSSDASSCKADIKDQRPKLYHLRPSMKSTPLLCPYFFCILAASLQR